MHTVKIVAYKLKQIKGSEVQKQISQFYDYKEHLILFNNSKGYASASNIFKKDQYVYLQKQRGRNLRDVEKRLKSSGKRSVKR